MFYDLKVNETNQTNEAQGKGEGVIDYKWLKMGMFSNKYSSNCPYLPIGRRNSFGDSITKAGLNFFYTKNMFFNLYDISSILYIAIVNGIYFFVINFKSLSY